MKKIAAQSSISTEKIRSHFLHEEHFRAYEMGTIDSETFFRYQKEKVGFRGEWKELSEIWCGFLSPIPRHIALAKRLSSHYQLGLLSNTNPAHCEVIEACDFIFYFPTRIYSHHLKVMKPHRKIYEVAAATMKSVPEQILYIDDLQKNVETARELGWKTIHLTREIDLEKTLRQLNLTGF